MKDGIWVCLLMCLFMQHGQAELERWTDDNGVIYYRNLQTPVEAEPVKAAKPAVKKKAAASPSSSSVAKQERKAALQRRKEQERADARTEKHCARLQKKIDRIQHKLDSGYREPQGNNLRRERRDLQSQWFRECR